MTALFIFAATMAVYLSTIAPTLSFFDSGEMIAGAYTLGVSHPPGYPVYVTLGKLFSFLPLGSVAFRVNLMSSFFASMTSVLIYYITRSMLENGDNEPFIPGLSWMKATPAGAAGVFAAFAFAFSYNLWAWAVVSKFYTLNAFVVACILMLLIRWRRARKEEGDTGGGHSLSYLYVMAFIWGIAGVVHISQFVLIPVYLLYILIVDGSVFVEMKGYTGSDRWNPVSLVKRVNLKTILIMAFFFILGHSIYLHLPLRAAQEPLINWGGSTDWTGFKWVYNREGYPTVGGERTLGLLWKQLQSFNLVREFTWAGIPLILLGLYSHFRKDWRHFLILLFGSVLMVSAIVIGGNPVEENIFLLEQFYMPVYIFLCVLMGGAVYMVLENRKLGPWVMGLTMPFIFLGNIPTVYVNRVLGKTGGQQTFHLMGRTYDPWMYFLFYFMVAAIIIIVLSMLPMKGQRQNKFAYVGVFFLLLVFYPASELKANYWKNDRSHNFIAYDMGNAELTFAPQFAVLFTWGDSGAFPMWYLQDVERKRPDVLLVHTPHLPLEWFLQSIKREPGEIGDMNEIRDYRYLRNYNGIKGIEQLLSMPEDFRDPAAMIKDIATFNNERPLAFDYSSRYSVSMPYSVYPYGITYRAMEKNYLDENLRTWNYLVTRNLPAPTIALDLDEQKAVSIYGYVRADLGRQYIEMGYKPMAQQEFAAAVSYAPELWESLSPYMQ
jgi:hypothetical protein